MVASNETKWVLLIEELKGNEYEKRRLWKKNCVIHSFYLDISDLSRSKRGGKQYRKINIKQREGYRERSLRRRKSEREREHRGKNLKRKQRGEERS